MDSTFLSKYRIVTISGKIAVGTTTLTRNLQKILGWKHVNVGAIQREFDRKQGINENKQGAASRSDAHEKAIDAATIEMLKKESNIIYEAWLSGFMARGIDGVLKVLVTCSHDDIRIDRVANRDSLSIDEAKIWMRQREEENIRKWKKLYGDHDFWDKKYYDLVIDTYNSGPMETMGKVLDRLGKK